MFKKLKSKQSGVSSRTHARETFHKTGLSNIADLAADTSSEDEAPPPPPAPKNSFLDALGEARQGHEDFVFSKKRQPEQRRDRGHEDAKDRYTTFSQDANNDMNIRALEELNNALRNGTAYVDSYRPSYGRDEPRRREPYRPLDPLGQTRFGYSDITNERPTRNNPNPRTNSCQVGLCDHEDLCIVWEPQDSDNKKGTWRIMMKHYFDYAEAHEDHKLCPPPDISTRGKVLASRIIQKFIKMEDEKLNYVDRLQGKQPQRSPRLGLVEREVLTMISHMVRTKETERIVEARESSRRTVDAAERRKELAEKTQQQAQQERQRTELAKGINIDDLEEDEEPVVKHKTMKRKVLSNDEDDIAESTRKRQKVATKPGIVSKEGIDHGKRVNAVVSVIAKSRSASVKRVKVVPKPMLIAGPESDQQSVKKDSRNLKEGSQPKTVSTPEVQKDVAEAAIAPSKQTSQVTMTKKQALLAKEELVENHELEKNTQDQSKANAEDEKDSAYLAESTSKHEEKEVVKTETKTSLPTASPKSTITKKRKSSTAENDDLSSQKKSRKTHRSAAVIEDSDNEADYELPAIPTDLPTTGVRQGWQAESAALVEDAVQHQEDVELEREEKLEQGKVVVVDEVTEAVNTTTPPDLTEETQGTVKDTTAPDEEVHQLTPPSPPPSPSHISGNPSSPPPLSPSAPSESSGQKRNPPSPEIFEPTTPPSSPHRPRKKAKTVHFSPEVVSPLETWRRGSVPWVVDVVVGRVVWMRKRRRVRRERWRRRRMWVWCRVGRAMKSWMRCSTSREK